MLKTIVMPDGSPCSVFHAADIVGRDKIKDSPFKGWTFQDEIAAFDKAITVVEDRSTAAILWPVGVALELPATFPWIPRDSIWLMLFAKLFALLARIYPAQRSIALMFDEKKAIKNNALQLHAAAKENFNANIGEEYLSSIAFDDDANIIPLQAADLLVYEWRKRITDETEQPDKANRKSYARIRAARPDGALWRYGRALFDEASRAMQFAIDVCELIRLLPHSEPGPTVRRQLAKSATSVLMNHRAACRARSHKEFTARIGVVAEEADESLGWLQFIERARLVSSPELVRLRQEASELAAIFSASVGTARHRERAEFR